MRHRKRHGPARFSPGSTIAVARVRSRSNRRRRRSSVAGMGTGGTLTGVARVLSKERPDTKIVVCEPADAPMPAQSDKVGPDGLQSSQVLSKPPTRFLVRPRCFLNSEVRRRGRMVLTWS